MTWLLENEPESRSDYSGSHGKAMTNWNALFLFCGIVVFPVAMLALMFYLGSILN